MALAVNVTFLGMPPSPALRSDIEARAAKLTQFAPRLKACDVSVRLNEHRHVHDNRYLVHAHLTLPGGDIQAGRSADADHSHEDPYLAVRDAFDALRRQLEDYVRIRRGDIKAHPPNRATSSRS
jgi:ribosome-associated translation inhibitor RaiA